MTNEEMAKRIQQGDESLKTELWEATRNLIYYFLQRLMRRNPANTDRMISRGVTVDDVQQEAFFVLLHAIEHFTPAGGYSFQSQLNYSTKTIFFELIGMRTANGRRDILSNASSLDEPILGTEEGDISLVDTIPDKEASEPFEIVIEDELRAQCRKAIHAAMEVLTDKERQAINGVYFERKTLKSLGQVQGVCLQAIRQAQQSGLRKLRRGTPLRLLRPYAEEIIDSYAFRGSVGSFNHTWSSSTEIAAMKLEQAERKNGKR